ncbi:MAG: AraC family transcriptional regulator ligand-binding domain-containing protein, partial [Polyangiaceae bacterium]
MALTAHAHRAPRSRVAPAHSVPMPLVTQLAELVERWSVPAAELLGGMGLTVEALGDPLCRVDLETMSWLLERARTLTGEPGLGYYLGLHKRVSIYGYLGFVAASSASLRDALAMAIEFAPVFSTAIGLELREEGGVASLCFEERADLGRARDIILISMMFGMGTVGRALTGGEPVIAADVAMDFTFAEPEYQPRFSNLVPGARFGQASNRVIFDSAALDRSIVTADREALKLARALCDRELFALDAGAGLPDRVRGELWSDAGGLRSLQEVAKRLAVSSRTLKRRLAASDVSFSELVERDRRERAIILLRSSLSIDQVAERLEYSRAATFVRAFHRWMGTTPAVYR